MAATMKNARPVSSVVPSYARQFADDSRERSGSASSVPAMPTTTMNSGNMASSGQGVSHPNGQVPVPRDRPRQVSNDSLIASTTPPPPFKPVTMEQVMASAGQDAGRALTELLVNFNNVLQERDHERYERVRIGNANSKLWTLWGNVKREREALQRDLSASMSSGPSASQREIRQLATRVIELEAILHDNGLPVPPPSSSRLSPSIGLSESEPRRPSPGSRSASDNSGGFRERQRSFQGQTERERATAMTGSASMNSFATMNSDAGPTGRDRDREKQRRADAGTPPASYSSPAAHMISDGQAITASPQHSRAREAFSPIPSSQSSMPPLSSSASTSTLASYQNSISSNNPANLPMLQPRDKSGLATIPSTPIINGGEGEAEGRFAEHGEHQYTASPTANTFLAGAAHPNRSVASLRSERSDAGSSDHLRIAKHSPIPASPALSAASSAAPSHISSTHSPRSPNPLHSPASSQHHSSHDSPRHPNHGPPPLSQSATNIPRIISRKASSLDLARPDKASPRVPSRSATPPPDLGSPKQPQSPTQYAVVPPRTPARRTSLDEALGSMSYHDASFEHRPFGTPMQDMPDEARRYIMATDGGIALPSPSSPLVPVQGRAQAAIDSPRQDLPHTRPGGLGITAGLDEGSLHAGSAQRPRRASSALQAIAAQAVRQLPGPAANGQTSPLEGGLQPSFGDSPYRHQQRSLPDPRPEADSQAPAASERARAHTTGQPPQAGQYRSPAMPGYHVSAPPPLSHPPTRIPSSQRSKDDYGNPQAGAAPSFSQAQHNQQYKFIPLVPGLLGVLQVDVVYSPLKIGDRSREQVIFHIRIALKTGSMDEQRRHLIPQGAPKSWLIEKGWSDVQGLDAALKAKNPKSNLRKLPSLPDKKLFRDHAPTKADQRKRELKIYLQAMCEAAVLLERGDVCTFLTSNIISDRAAPVSNPGYKAGFLTKKGRNFGHWSTRYYVIQGRMLEYYDAPGGQHLGSIDIKGANIGRQNSNPSQTGDDSILHAFLIRAKDKAGEETDHILCAENDEDRDAWVNMLVCCLTGEYKADTVAQSAVPMSNSNSNSGSGPTQRLEQSNKASQQPSSDRLKQHSARNGSRDLEIKKGSAQPISQLHQGPGNQKLFNAPASKDAYRERPSGEAVHRREPSAGQSSIASGQEESVPPPPLHQQRPAGKRIGHGSDLPSSTSLPAHLDQMTGSASQSSLPTTSTSHSRLANTLNASDADLDAANGGEQRSRSPEKRIKISAPSNGVPIGADFKRKEERRNKVKSSFWGFADRRTHERKDAPASAPRPVFGVPIQEAVEIARVREDSDLPAVVFRCVQYLSNVKAEKEEGIYRMSGSSAVIKGLKDRFNAEGDVDLTAEYYDPHAIAGLLKTYFRELPVHIFTSDLNPEFIRANEIEDARQKVREITRLVSLLPVANYSALRFLAAHLVKIVKEEQTNKMNIRNMGIVFSPTLAIPATLFGLFIVEFDRIFREIDVEDDDTSASEATHVPKRRSRQRTQSGGARRRSRNSTLFTQSGADRLLELTSDLEASPEIEEDAAYDSENDERLRAYQPSPDPRPEGDDTIRARHRHKLTIDVTTSDGEHSGGASNRSELGQKSPSISSANSPRHHYSHNNALRSPGLPASPRHTETYQHRRE